MAAQSSHFLPTILSLISTRGRGCQHLWTTPASHITGKIIEPEKHTLASFTLLLLYSFYIFYPLFSHQLLFRIVVLSCLFFSCREYTCMMMCIKELLRKVSQSKMPYRVVLSHFCEESTGICFFFCTC